MLNAAYLFLKTGEAAGTHPPSAAWVILALSFASVILQLVCFTHLRSTIEKPPLKVIFLGSRLSTRLLDDDGLRLPSPQHNERSAREQTVDVVDYFSSRMEEAREFWARRLETLRGHLHSLPGAGRLLSPTSGAGGAGGSSALAGRPADRALLRRSFHLLVKLHAYDDSALEDLEVVAAMDSRCLEFFAPQLVSFLIWDSYFWGGQLEAWLLRRCRDSLFFAHLVEWHLSAFCLGETLKNGAGARAESAADAAPSGVAPIDERSREALRRLLREVREAGSEAALRVRPLLSATPEAAAPLVPKQELITSAALPLTPLSVAEAAPAASTAPLRAIALASPVAAAATASTSAFSASDAPSLSSPGEAVSAAAVPSSDIRGASSGLASNYSAAPEPIPTLHDRQGYSATPDFVALLEDVSRRLAAVPKPRRSELLVQHVSGLAAAIRGAEGEGAPLVYFPVGDRHARIVDIHPEECRAFSTKERVPILIVAEAVGLDFLTDLTSAETANMTAAATGASELGTINDGSSSSAEHHKETDWERLRRRLRPPRFWRRSLSPSKPSSPPRSHAERASLLAGRGDEEEGLSGGYGVAAPAPAAPATAAAVAAASDLRGGKEKLGQVVAEDLGALGQWAEPPPAAGGGVSGVGGGGGGSGRSRAGGSGAGAVVHGLWRGGREHEEDSRLAVEGEDQKNGVSTARNSADGEEFDEEKANLRDRESPSKPSSGSKGGGAGSGGGGGGSGSGAAAAPPEVVFQEPWAEKSERIRRASPWGRCPGWRLVPVIIKSNDDLRQESLASQLLWLMHNALVADGLPEALRPYDILSTSADAGVIEAIPDTVSLDALRRGDASYTTLLDWFERRFGGRNSDAFVAARRRFMESLAAYSVACYLLQIKDRHNGNILLHSSGRIIHIDFGFILANSPGGNFAFERAPFKLTREFIDLLGGDRSATFRRFRETCARVYLSLRRRSQEIVLLLEMSAAGNEGLPCFRGEPARVVAEVMQRFQPELNDGACVAFVHELVDQSIDNWRTRWYDRYQRLWVGVY